MTTDETIETGKPQPGRSAADLAAEARAASPRPLSGKEMDRSTGRLHWPGALQDDSFVSLRHTVDEYAAKWAEQGRLTWSDEKEMRKGIKAMYDLLKTEINEMPPQDYVICRSFLERLQYAATHTAF